MNTVELADIVTRVMAAMIYAIKNEQYDVVKDLLAKKNMDELENNAHLRPGNMSLLAVAINVGHRGICQALMDAGANPNFGGRTGKFPLYIAAHDGKLAILKDLIERGADINMKYLTGNTALLEAVQKNHSEMVPYLIGAGANPLVANNAGETGLHLAAITANLDHMKIFLEAGVNVNACKGLNLNMKKGFCPHSNTVCLPKMPTDRVSGNTPLHLAVYAASDRHLLAVQLLIGHGALVNAQLPNGHTPLHMAATNNAVNIARLLLSHGCRVDPVSIVINECRTPLLMAVFAGHVTMVQTLIDAGADINFRDLHGCTPLFSAICYGMVEIVLVLLRAGCDVNISSENGLTPLKASLRHKPHMTQMLVFAGCTLGPNTRLLLDSPIDNQLYNSHHDVRDWILNMISTPKALQQLCREAIRKQIKANMATLKLESLPLPPKIVEYLNLNDAEEIFTYYLNSVFL